MPPAFAASFTKKNTGASIETPVFRNNIFMLVPYPKKA
ncbi:hypothetical protein FAEPRAM212_01511 [Faecalibacterium prausnitzii M21/2]|uniref:Uncharacterized protein n=1 Tax=Faecalibacterium prausnitzii M21/2 TaxID=411485 RepID=A8SAY9_9FIRM|nr:hypothetical protein FAEPRAM212_01511 [Faecalibacterium prausnitzii M21/2]